MITNDWPGGTAEPTLSVHGVVAHDDGEALFAAVSLATAPAEVPGLASLPGLDPKRNYRVRAELPTLLDGDYAHTFSQIRPPAWLDDGAVATGAFLQHVGLPLPVLNPEHALLLHVQAL